MRHVGDKKGHKYDTTSRNYFADGAVREIQKVVEWMTCCTSSVAKLNGNRNVPYLYRNGSNRDLNLNWRNDDWNGNYRFLAVRYSFDFSRAIVSGVLFATCRLQPPSILPISARYSER